ncbi:Dam family site-specific DNA-(adenine-N6)-methyltransferase [Micromonospora rifamycinica]|uniref:DNA adenine methylase n=1 Tax=Micromonospora rifamycinica TaxID=291594 RepID=UPI003414FBF2
MRPIGLQPMTPLPGEGKSFLKWAGGKTRYAKTLVAVAPAFTGTYREPFLGSGAVFFELNPSRAILSDANEELIICFREVAKDAEAVMKRLDDYINTREHFEEVRSQNPAALSNLDRAARVIYLNKTSFRGLWRVNQKGQFNTPYGAYDRPYYSRQTLSEASKLLAGAEIRVADFQEQLDQATEGDWVYLDPPYIPLGGWADFKRYTPGQFNEDDHIRLFKAMKRASERGVFVTLSNSDTPFVRDLFKNDFNIAKMATRRDINLQAAKRENWDLVVTNYKLPNTVTQLAT